MYQAGLVLSIPPECWTFLPKKELTSPISMGYLPEHAICAAICPDKRDGH